MVVNMIKPLRPSIQTFLLQINELLTETTPESSLTVAANPTAIKLLLDFFIFGDLVLLLEMVLEGLTTVANFGTSSSFGTFRVAAPGFQVEVLRVFVALPIIFAAEVFVAGQECAAIRPLVTLHVFPGAISNV
tara:strand:- start:1893 stop:2291 length:399 start_codon:yes stop_codon:yes gene_type:complete